MFGLTTIKRKSSGDHRVKCAFAPVKAAALLASLLASSASPHTRYTGINIATGGFAGKDIPGIYGKNYIYPQPKEIQPFLEAGMNTARVPFLWERIQPVLNGPLDQTELARLDASLSLMKGYELIILDVHNYAHYRGTTIGEPGVSDDMLADLWGKLAAHYKGNSHIAFGLMNEPNGILATDWKTAAEKSIVAIRRAGARNLILVPGNSWSGVLRWYTGGPESNGQAMQGLQDPDHNFAIEMHIYFDVNSSGTHWTCPDDTTAEKGILKATSWLNANHYRGFIGEFGSPPNEPVCLSAMDKMLSAMDQNSTTWLGWTYWAGGAWWGKYPLSIQPDTPGEIKPQLAVLQKHLYGH